LATLTTVGRSRTDALRRGIERALPDRPFTIGDPYVFSDEEQQAFRDRLRTPRLLKKTWDHYRSTL